MCDMKDSGIEWVGQIPSSWNCKPIRHTVKEYFSGSWGNDEKQDDNDRICMRIADFDFNKMRFKELSTDSYTVRNYTNADIYKRTLSYGDLLVEKSGGGEKTPVGRTVVYRLPYKALFANFMDCIRLNDLLDVEFAKYAFYSLYCNGVTNLFFNQTTGLQNLNMSRYLKEAKIPVPGQNVQRRIADFLDSKCAEIDALTADIEKQIETLEQYKRSVITEAVTKGLDKNVEMKESKLEWVDGIPLNWEEKPYRVLFSEVTTKNKFGQEKNALKFTYGNIVPKTDFDADTDEYVADTILTYTIVEPGTIMINCLNLNYDFISQRIGLVKDKGIITSAYLAIKPNSQMVCDRFANYQLKAFDGMKVFHNMGTGIRKTLGFDELGKKYFILPPLDEQMKIANYLDAKSEEIQAIINNKKEELSSLAEYKKSLIYEYVTGKKEVS